MLNEPYILRINGEVLFVIHVCTAMNSVLPLALVA